MEKSRVQIITSEFSDKRQTYAVAIFGMNIKSESSDGLGSGIIDLIKGFEDAFNAQAKDGFGKRIIKTSINGFKQICIGITLQDREKITLEEMKKNATDLIDQFEQLLLVVEDNS